MILPPTEPGEAPPPRSEGNLQTSACRARRGAPPAPSAPAGPRSGRRREGECRVQPELGATALSRLHPVLGAKACTNHYLFPPSTRAPAPAAGSAPIPAGFVLGTSSREQKLMGHTSPTAGLSGPLGDPTPHPASPAPPGQKRHRSSGPTRSAILTP